jgi:hypothetical protein
MTGHSVLGESRMFLMRLKGPRAENPGAGLVLEEEPEAVGLSRVSERDAEATPAGVGPAAASEVPQWLHNLAPSRTGFPHCGQNTVETPERAVGS